MWTPLLVKPPHQAPDDAEVSLAPMESVDLLPTLADMLGIDLPFDVDGASIAGRDDAPDGDDLRRTYRWKGFSDITPFPGEDYALVDGAASLRALLDLEPWPRQRDGSLRLFAFGRHGALVGEPVDDLRVGDPAPFDGQVDDPDETLDSDSVELDWGDVDLDAEVLPAYVRGTIDTRQPVDVVVAVNGVVAGWCPSFVDSKQADDTQSFFTMIPEELLADGRNEITLYAVDRADANGGLGGLGDANGDAGGDADDVVLHPVTVR